VFPPVIPGHRVTTASPKRQKIDRNMRLRSIVLPLIIVAIGIAALAAGYYYTHGKPSAEDLRQIHESAEAAAKQAAAIQATLPRTPPAGSIQKATANVDVTIEI